MDYISILWQVILYLFAVVGFFNAAKTFYNNFIKYNRPKLEIDFKLSFKVKDDSIEYTNFIKVLNNSDKIAYRVKLYIANGGNKLTISRDFLKPAQEPFLHESKTSFNKTENQVIEASDFFNDMMVIAEYKDSRQNTYYTRRRGIDNKSTLFASKKRPKEIDSFIAKIERLN